MRIRSLWPLVATMAATIAKAAQVVLWNTRGSVAEIENSQVGANGVFGGGGFQAGPTPAFGGACFNAAATLEPQRSILLLAGGVARGGELNPR